VRCSQDEGGINAYDLLGYREFFTIYEVAMNTEVKSFDAPVTNAIFPSSFPIHQSPRFDDLVYDMAGFS